MSTQKQEDIRKEVQAYYGAVAKGKEEVYPTAKKEASGGCCAPTCCDGDAPAKTTVKKEASVEVASMCCGSDAAPKMDVIASALGYKTEELSAAPEGANLGLGCGNPQAIASLQEGEVVLDLGSGAGFDSFLAARQVGKKGRVIGVDMTPEMLLRARNNAKAGDFSQVEFREGLIEALPVEDQSVDVAISNCVINLSPDKPQVFREIFRVLRPGGRVAISDVVALQPLPAAMREAIGMIAGCVGQAAETRELEQWLLEAGFVDIRIEPKLESRAFIQHWFPNSGAEEFVASAVITAKKAS